MKPGIKRDIPEIHNNNLIDYIRDRELGMKSNVKSPESRWMLKEDLHDIVSANLPYSIRKELIRYPYEDKCDKIFASQWIGPDSICFGTKDNQLLLWSYSTGNVTNLTLPDYSSKKSMVPVRTPTPMIGEPIVSSDSSSSLLMSSPLPTTGIHDIDMNPSKTRLVSGGKNDRDLALFSMPSLKPSAILHGHQDCVFASKFITDDIILSGGRDGILLQWKLPKISCISDDTDDDAIVVSPSQCAMRSPFRIRSIEHCKYTDRAFVLCGGCSLAVFDSRSMIQTKRILLPEEADLVSLALNSENGIVAVGNQSGTILLDMYNGNSIAELSDIGLPYGVRSLVFNKNLLTIGGGNGNVDFYDIRMLSRRIPNPLTCSLGSIRNTQDCVFSDIQQAIYTLNYDPDYGNKLFVAGGPLICGLSGSYASIWA